MGATFALASRAAAGARRISPRVTRGGADAWGYRDSPRHLARADFLLAALPDERFARALEVGCAQGFLSERLAARAGRLIGCDLSAEAIAARAGELRRLANVEFVVADIRAGFPGEAFDLCLFSDVLYYLSPRETDAVLAEAARRTRQAAASSSSTNGARARRADPAALQFRQARRLRRMAAHGASKTPFGEAELSLAVYRRA